MKQANEYLKDIFGVLTKIEQSQRASAGPTTGTKKSEVGDAMNISSSLSSFAKIKPKTTQRFIDFSKEILKVVKESKGGKAFNQFSEALINVSNALPEMAKGLDELGRIKSRRVNLALGSIRKLYDLMYELGDRRSSRRVQRATRLFRSLGKALYRIAKPMRILSSFLTFLGLSFVIFAGGIVAASALLKVGSPMGVVGALVGVVVSLMTVIGLLAVANRFLKPGIRAIKNIGMGFALLTLGILGFALGVLMIASYLGTGNDWKGVGKAMLVMGGVILLVVGMFALLGLASKFVKPGIRTVRGMGLGLFILIGGIFLFTVGLIAVAGLLSLSGNVKGIALAMGVMALSIGALVALFAVLGKAKKQVAMGTLVAILVSAGIMIIGYSVKFLAEIARDITNLGQSEKGEQKGPLGKILSSIGPGLGVIGGIFIAAAGLFAVLGIPAVAGLVALGAATAIAVSGSLYVLAISVKKLSEVAGMIEPDFPNKLGFMIGGVFTGMLKGMDALTEGKRGLKGFATFIKNSAKIFAVTGVLMAVSISLSMFAKALTAFAELSNMRVIKGHKENGEPIFGEKVNITNVSENISTSISTFLSAILESTEGLTKNKARAIRKMSRALTGRRGILTAVIQFADVLKSFSEFGPAGEIGFVELQDTGKKDPDTGQPILKEVKSKVKITEVTSNIIESFGTFVDELTADTDRFGIGGRDGRKMKRLAEVLLGKKGRKGREKYGLLQPIQAFSETLTIYAKYGSDLKIPILDADGNEVGDPVDVTTIAKNIVKTLSAFTTELAGSIITGDIKQAEKNLKKFDNVIDRVSKIATSLDSMSKLSLSVQNLAEGIGDLADNLEKLDSNKLDSLATSIIKGAGTPAGQETTPAREISRSQQSRETPTTTRSGEPKWDVIAAQIGDQVGNRIAEAMREGHLKFEFSSTGGNEGVMMFD